MNRQNKFRRLWILGLSLLLLLSFGCNGGDSDSDGDNDADRFTIEYLMLQYRNFENPANNFFRGLIGVADNGGAALETDVVDSDMTDSAGTSVIGTQDGFYTQSAYDYDCRGGSCSQTGPVVDTGLWGTFDSLEADTYSVTLDMVNEQTLTGSIAFPGMVTIPCVLSASMQSEMSGDDLELSWTNPTAQENWDQVDQIRIDIIDGSNATVITIKLDATAASVTIPAALIADAEALGDGSLAQWRIQTRAYDDSNMNYARGYSNKVNLAGSEPFSIEYAMIQYRTFEDSGDNATRGVVGIYENSNTIDASDVTDFTMSDSGGGAVTINNGGVWVLNSYWYDCMGGTCNQTGPVADSGLWLAMDSLAQDIYTVDVNMSNGQALSVDIDYPAETAIPVVASLSMIAAWNGDDLDLSWTNPTSGTNWDQVDQIRIELSDSSDSTVINVKLDSTATSVTIPAALIADAKALGDGTLTQWRIQTRANDDNNMNYARGYSNTVSIAGPASFSIPYAMLQYRTYESTADNVRGVVGLAVDGNAVKQADVGDSRVNGPGGAVTINSSGIWFLDSYWYDCSLGACIETGLKSDSGIWMAVGNQAAGTYTFEVDMINGQTVSADVAYPTEMPIPVIATGAMTAAWNGDDLDLSWVLPTGGTNWGEVDQIRIELINSSNETVIYVKMANDDTAVTIPGDMITAAQDLEGGDPVVQWRMQTRAIDGNNMNFSRGYSNKKDLP